jgi:hypothetical protein
MSCHEEAGVSFVELGISEPQIVTIFFNHWSEVSILRMHTNRAFAGNKNFSEAACSCSLSSMVHFQGIGPMDLVPN